MRLLHIHLPHLTPYPVANSIQSHLLSLHTTHRALLNSTTTLPAGYSPVPPPPTILTFSTPPTYTAGRRYLTRNPLPASQIAYLQGVLLEGTSTSARLSQNTYNPNPPSKSLATFHPCSRGGDLTYHGPGQLTAYTIINLRTHRLTARQYIHLIESTVIKTCARLGVVRTGTTPDPGVWIRDSDPPRKICAVGIQVSSGITSHGIGLNVDDAPIPLGLKEMYRLSDDREAQGYLSWGFDRIVACGLEGKSVTWLTAEGTGETVKGGEVRKVLAEELAKALSCDSAVKVDGIDEMVPEDVEGLIYKAQELLPRQRAADDKGLIRFSSEYDG